MLRYIRPRNFLSFDLDEPGIELTSLNVLIGPNGSGKSNLVEAIHFMRSSPGDLQSVTRRGGGTAEWVKKGQKNRYAQIELVDDDSVRHHISFTSVAQSFELATELIAPATGFNQAGEDFFYSISDNVPILRTQEGIKRSLDLDQINRNQSILSQLMDPQAYPQFSTLRKKYEQLRIYRDWSFGRSPLLRQPQAADMRTAPLEEDFSNLGLFLNRLQAKFPKAKRELLTHLQDLYPGITDFGTQTEGSTVQLFVTEGDYTIPAIRLSDGTLRYLCLLAILCDPEPPPLVCIEEPELGLHPDLLPKLAELLKAFSERSQLLVTTHSDILVDALTESPSAVIICEKRAGSTWMRRLDPVELKSWLENYTLGELWTRGGLGGNRW